MIEGLLSVGPGGAATVVLGLTAIILFGKVLDTVKALVVNTIGGLIVLFGANTIGITIAYTPFTLAIAAIAGVPGGVLMVLLSILGIPLELPAV